MAFLTSLDILDTGFLSKNSVTRTATANMVNAGSALRLKSVELDINSKAQLDISVSPNNHDTVRDEGAEEHPLITINPTDITIKITINSKNVDTTNMWGINDMDLLKYLLRLPHTRGLKALYYPVSGNFNSRDKQLIYQIGANDILAGQDTINITLATSNGDTTGTSGFDLTNVNYVLCRFTSCSMKQVSSNLISVTLSGVRTI